MSSAPFGLPPPQKALLDTSHEHFMTEAIDLARTMQGYVWPNPPVGCVIARNGAVVGRGRTQAGGRPHAERIALEAAGSLAVGATLYVTLEPCCHWGRSPPCVDAIIAAGVTAVYASMQDPDPRVDGRGFRKLKEAGIEVETGLGASQARDIMAGFLHRVTTGWPLVTIGDENLKPGELPDRFDARLESDGERRYLLTRTVTGNHARQTLDIIGDMHAFLDILGGLGLTSVYVSSGDRLAGPIDGAVHQMQGR